jgi:hypothetical protein
MRPAPSTLRVAALLSGAELVLHELRYLIGYGHHSGEALHSQGHSYLPLATAAAMALLAVAGVQLVALLARARRSGAAEPAAPRFGGAWLVATAGLLVAYTSQELLEGVLSAGHPEGLGALAAHGGWTALPLALALGALVAGALRGASAAVAAAARRGRRTALPRPSPLSLRPLAGGWRPISAPLARHLAGRAPPATS